MEFACILKDQQVLLSLKHNIQLRPEPVQLIPLQGPSEVLNHTLLSKRKEPFYTTSKVQDLGSGSKKGPKRVKICESLPQARLGSSVNSTSDFLSQLNLFGDSTNSILIELANVNLHLGTKTNSSRFKWLKTLNHYVKFRYFYSELEECLFNPAMFFTFFRSLIGNFGKAGKLTFYEFKHIKRQYLTPKVFQTQFVVSVLKNRLKQHQEALIQSFSNLQETQVLFYDEFSGLIYQGKIIRINSNKAMIETPKKTFKVSLPNVKLLQREQTIIKSEFFSRDELDPSFKVPHSILTPHQNQQIKFFPSINSVGNQQDNSFSIPKPNDNPNLSSFLKTNTSPLLGQKDSSNDFSIPLFPQNVSGVLDSLRHMPRSDKSNSKSDFNLLPSFQSKKSTSSKFQSIVTNSRPKEVLNSKVSPSQVSSLNPSIKPFNQLQSLSLARSQPLSKFPLNTGLFTPTPVIANQGNVQVKNETNKTNALETHTKPPVIDNDLVNFAILFKLLQKKKKLAVMHDRLVKTRSETNLETNIEDLKWVKKSVTQIDKTLKNVWLSLKLRDTTITSKSFK